MKALVADRRALYFAVFLTAFIIAAIYGYSRLSIDKKELRALREQQKEIAALKNDFASLQQTVTFIEARKRAGNIQGIVQAVDEIFLSIGLKDKVKSVRTAGSREVADGIQEDANVSIEKVSMNELLNIFHKIENAPMILSIKKASIKKTFENPQLLNITLSLSFIKAK